MTYYEVLGVPTTATADEIKAAHRKLVMKHHPDKNPGDSQAEAKFKEIQTAYDVLSDETKKSNYDQFGNSNAPQRRSSTVNVQMSGNDISVVIPITFEESFNGSNKTVTYKREVGCGSCKATGVKPGGVTEVCRRCGGGGMHMQQHAMFQVPVLCNLCRGTGTSIPQDSRCTTCQGHGRVMQDERRDIVVPQGVDTNDGMRIQAYGHSGVNGGPNGDLLLHFQLTPHAKFKRSGNDILLDYRLPFDIMALGDKITVDSMKGKVEISIASGTQNGTTMRLSKMGFFLKHQNSHGDMLVKLLVDVPKKFSDKEKELLKKMATERKAKEKLNV